MISVGALFMEELHVLCHIGNDFCGNPVYGGVPRTVSRW